MLRKFYDNATGLSDFENEKEVIIPASFEKVKDFDCGLAKVYVGTLWGLINESGRTILPFSI